MKKSFLSFCLLAAAAVGLAFSAAAAEPAAPQAVTAQASAMHAAEQMQSAKVMHADYRLAIAPAGYALAASMLPAVSLSLVRSAPGLMLPPDLAPAGARRPGRSSPNS